MTKKLHYGLLFLGLFLLSSLACSDTLKLRNGSTIIGTYTGGTDDQINFRVGSTIQRYNVADVASISFSSYNSAEALDDSDGRPQNSQYQPPPPPPPPPAQDRDQDDSTYRHFSNNVTIPSGTRIVVRTIDPIDSDKNRAGDKFTATLDQALYVNDLMVAPRGADVYGRLEEVKQTGQLAGRSELRLALTGMTINGQTVQLSTSDYQLAGKSRGADTAKKVGGGAALGAIIGAVAGGGKGAAIGAGVGAGAGTAVQVVTHGDQVHVPSETVLEFTLNQPVTVNRTR